MLGWFLQLPQRIVTTRNDGALALCCPKRLDGQANCWRHFPNHPRPRRREIDCLEELPASLKRVRLNNRLIGHKRNQGQCICPQSAL